MTSYQKKLVGILIAIPFFLLNLFFLIGMIASIVIDEENSGQNIYSFLFAIAIFSFPLWYGLRMYKTAKNDSIKLTEPIDPEKLIRINVHITLPEYQKLITAFTYRNPIILYLHVIGLSFLIPPLVTNQTMTWGNLIGLGLILLPVIIFFQSKRNYSSNKNLKEKMDFEFTLDNILITGETFNTSIKWSSLHKVKEMKNWFLLYTSNQVAVLVPKRSFLHFSDLIAFKAFIINTKGIVKEF